MLLQLQLLLLLLLLLSLSGVRAVFSSLFVRWRTLAACLWYSSLLFSSFLSPPLGLRVDSGLTSAPSRRVQGRGGEEAEGGAWEVEKPLRHHKRPE